VWGIAFLNQDGFAVVLARGLARPGTVAGTAIDSHEAANNGLPRRHVSLAAPSAEAKLPETVVCRPTWKGSRPPPCTFTMYISVRLR
jgi:hypothetical protein